jgi:hypothetical protein
MTMILTWYYCPQCIALMVPLPSIAHFGDFSACEAGFENEQTDRIL